MNSYRAWLVALLCALLLPHAAVGQAVTIPRNVQAENIGKQIEPAKVPKFSDVPKKVFNPGRAPEGTDEVAFLLTSVQVDGVTAYPSDHFASYYKAMVGKRLPLSSIYLLADRIRQRYHEDGYVLTQVFLPPQDINEGKVRIRVTEGIITRVRWEGAEIRNDIPRDAAAEIARQRPFNSKILEDVMLRLNELPGIVVQAALEPLPKEIAAEGAAGLVLTVERKDPTASISIDNYASRFLGVWQSNTRAEAYGLLDDLDRLSFTLASAYDPSRLRYGAVQYGIPIHESGTTLTFNVNSSYTHPGYTLKDINVISRAFGGSLGVTQPIFRSRQEGLTLSAQLSIRRQHTDITRLDFSEDRLRTLETSVSYNLNDEWNGANLFELQYVRGLDLFNPTRRGEALISRANGNHDFHKVTLTSSRLQNLSDSTSLLASFSGQKSSSALFSSEQFGYGGSAFGRAYNASEISGDDGVSFSLELRHNITDGGVFYQPFLFYDIGKVWENEFNGDIESAASAGFGGRIQWGSLRLDSYLALPLTNVPGSPRLGFEDHDPMLGFNITQTF